MKDAGGLIMLQDVLAADGWREAFWLGTGGLGASALCVVGGAVMRKINAMRGKSPPSPEPKEQETEPSPQASDSQLEAIEGIGPAIAAHFRAREIRTFAELAQKSPDELRQILGEVSDFSLAQPISWPFQARLIASGQFEQFLNLAIALRAGVPALTHIEGIGLRRAAILKEKGVASVEVLRKTPAEDIAGWTSVSIDEASDWRREAERLYDGDPVLLAEIAEIEPAAQTSDESLTPQDAEDAVADPAPSGFDLDLPNGETSERRWWRNCPQCCAAGLSALMLVTITISWIAGCVPEKVIKPDCEHQCPKPAKLYRQIQTDNLFDTNTETLKDEARTWLDGLAAEINRQASDADDLPGALVVIGHADRRRSRLKGGNQALSERRAKAVADYITVQLNAKKQRWPKDIVFVLGKGDAEEHPLTKGLCETNPKDLDGCLKNDRRVDVFAFYIDRGVTPAATSEPPEPSPTPVGSEPAPPDHSRK